MGLSLRKIRFKDKNFLYDLRNQSDVIKNSIKQKKIKYKEHEKWIKNQFEKKINFNFIVLFNKKKIGYLRFDKIKDSFYVNIALIKKARDKGFAKKALLLGEKKILSKNLYSRVLKNNQKSLLLFRSCNYYIVNEYKKYFLMKKNSFKKNLELINQIELLRKKNNTNWMKILKIAFKFDPKNSAEAMGKINKHDKKISKLSLKLSRTKND